MWGILKDNSGVALILTILIISLVVALALQFNKSMWSNLHSATNFRDGIRLSCIARSGFDYCRAVLLEDALETNSDSLHEDWADSKSLSSNSVSMFEKDRFEVQIIDHSGRIQINKLIDNNGNFNEKQKDLISRLLSLNQFGLEPEQVGSIIDAIKDWIDPDNEVTGFGAEESYYHELERPYSCKNGPLEFPEELLLIKGITKEIFYGTKENPGIPKYLTFHGDGKININTADTLVFTCLSEQIDQGMIEDIIKYREDENNDFSNPGWYKNVPGMGHINIDDLVTTSSKYFELRSEAFKEAMIKRVVGMIKREGKTLQILSWKIE